MKFKNLILFACVFFLVFPIVKAQLLEVGTSCDLSDEELSSRGFVSDLSNFRGYLDLSENCFVLRAINQAQIKAYEKNYIISKETWFLIEDKSMSIYLGEFFLDDKNLVIINGLNKSLLTISNLTINQTLYSLEIDKNNTFRNLKSINLKRTLNKEKKLVMNGFIISGQNNTTQTIAGINFTINENDTLKIVDNFPVIQGSTKIWMKGAWLSIPPSDYSTRIQPVLDKNGEIESLVFSGKDFDLVGRTFSGTVVYEDASRMKLVSGSFSDTHSGFGVSGENILISYGSDISNLAGNTISVLESDDGSLYRAKGKMDFEIFETQGKLSSGKFDFLKQDYDSYLFLSDDAEAELPGLKMKNGISIVNEGSLFGSLNENPLTISQGGDYLKVNQQGEIMIQRGSQEHVVEVISPRELSSRINLESTQDYLNTLAPEQKQQCEAKLTETRKIIDDSYSSSNAEEYLSSHFSLTGKAMGDFEQSSFAQPVTTYHYTGSRDTHDPLAEGIRNFVGETCKGIIRQSTPYMALASAYPQLRFKEEQVVYGIMQNNKLSHEEKVNALLQSLQKGDIKKQDIVNLCVNLGPAPYREETASGKVFMDVAKRADITDKQISQAFNDQLMASVQIGGVSIVGGAEKLATGTSPGFFKRIVSGAIKNEADDAAGAVARVASSSSSLSLSDDFARATNINDLMSAIRKTGGIRGSSQFYTADELGRLIELARDGQMLAGADGVMRPATDFITNTAGLRTNVQRIISSRSQSFSGQAAGMVKEFSQDFPEGHYTEGFWKQWIGGTKEIPKQGPKIRVTATEDNAREVAKVVREACEARGVTYKVPQNLDNFKSLSGSQEGKFATIYVPDAQTGAQLAKDLDNALLSKGITSGNVPINDLPIGRSGMISFRYAGHYGDDIIAAVPEVGNLPIPDNLVRRNALGPQLRNALAEYYKSDSRQTASSATYYADLAIDWLKENSDDFVGRFNLP